MAFSPRGVHAVLHGHNKRVRADHRAQGVGGVDHLPRLDPQYHRIDCPSLCGVIGGQGRGSHEIALDAINPESVLPDRLQVFAPGNKDHFLPGLGQSPAQIAADATGAEYRDTQSILSFSQRLRPVNGYGCLARFQPSVRPHQSQ